MYFALFVDGRKERVGLCANEEDDEENKRKICMLGARRVFYDARLSYLQQYSNTQGLGMPVYAKRRSL